MAVLVVRHLEMPKRAQYLAGIFLFALLRWKRECQELDAGTAQDLNALSDPAPSSPTPSLLEERLEELTQAFQRSAKCQVSASCWQTSPESTISCCDHLPAFFFLFLFGERVLRSVPHHSLVRYCSSTCCCPLPLSCLSHPLGVLVWWLPGLSSSCAGSPENVQLDFRGEQWVCTAQPPRHPLPQPRVSEGVCGAEMAERG